VQKWDYSLDRTWTTPVTLEDGTLAEKAVGHFSRTIHHEANGLYLDVFSDPGASWTRYDESTIGNDIWVQKDAGVDKAVATVGEDDYDDYQVWAVALGEYEWDNQRGYTNNPYYAGAPAGWAWIIPWTFRLKIRYSHAPYEIVLVTEHIDGETIWDDPETGVVQLEIWDFFGEPVLMASYYYYGHDPFEDCYLQYLMVIDGEIYWSEQFPISFGYRNHYILGQDPTWGPAEGYARPAMVSKYIEESGLEYEIQEGD
jgi:hypothetical protein